ncbi:MAG: hypothetical protein NC117_04245 [Pseudoflavonifractor sp.]|nr:hypothetical protein [Pseudoflavonifractor sp.]
MGSIWIWILIAIVFGVMCGWLFTCVTRKDVDNGDEMEASASGNLILNICLFSVIGFLIMWLLGAIIGW